MAIDYIENNKRMNELFKEWEQNKEFEKDGEIYFVRDGIADVETWKNTKVKVLFLLKEMNHNGERQRNTDLRHFLSQEEESATGSVKGRGKTWNNITRWYNALIDPNLAFVNVQYIDGDRRLSDLRHIAAINCKKSPGEATSNDDKIRSAFDKNNGDNYEYICEEIKLLGPLDYIVCCGNPTFECINKILGKLYGEANWKKYEATSGKVRFSCIKADGCPTIIDAYHPQARTSAKDMFEVISKIAKNEVKEVSF